MALLQMTLAVYAAVAVLTAFSLVVLSGTILSFMGCTAVGMLLVIAVQNLGICTVTMV